MAREPWLDKLQQGQGEAAWDLLIEQYHRLIAATVRHYGDGYDEVMDMFAYVCESLRANDLARLRKFAAIPEGRVRFSTWLVAVTRNLVIDWFRHQHGRKRLDKVVAELPTAEREAFKYVFQAGYSAAEGYELISTKSQHPISFGEFLKCLARAQRRISAKRPGLLLKELASAAHNLTAPGSAANPDKGIVADSDRPDAQVILRETREWLSKALATLPVEERIALHLYLIEGLPAADVADLLGWTRPKTVYNRVYRSLVEVRRFLEEKGIQVSDLL